MNFLILHFLLLFTPMASIKDYVEVVNNEYTHVGFKELKGSLKDGSKTLLEMLINRVRTQPNREIFGTIIDENISYLSYEAMDLKARRLAVFLEKITEEKEIIGIASNSRVEWIIAEYASYYANCINAPVYNNFTESTLCDIVEMTKMNIIIASIDSAKTLIEGVYSKCEEHKFKHIILMDRSDDLIDMCKSKDIKITVLDDIINNEDNLDCNPTRKHPKFEDIASICFTSGTGGKPKGVKLTHSNFIAHLEGFEIGSKSYDVINVNRNDVYISYLPLAHVFERICVCICIDVGGKVCFYRGLREKIAEDYKIIQPTFIVAVPKVLKLFHDTIEKKVMERGFLQRAVFRVGMKYKMFMQRFGIYRSWLWDTILFGKIANLFGGRIRAGLCGGAIVDPDLISYMEAILSAKIFQGYGQTEGLGANVLSSFSCNDPATIGIPFISTKIKLESLDSKYPSDNKKLLMKGPGISRGYYGQKERGEDEWLDTGDIVKLANGCLYIVGRYKDQMKLGNGEYIDPETLETYIQEKVKKINDIYITVKQGQIDLVALVVCTDLNIQEKDIARLIRSAVKELVNENKINRFISIHYFVLKRELFSELMIDNEGLLTTTLKKKRYLIDKYFSDDLNKAYQGTKY